eukprot:TRINITY_DN3826_c0_g2_i16.p2 TRINITY_DN3826_c0_g2~~TRINITY_DN3826_c0_g2_i16.p2  ORF type:complete len:122 (-),score=17.10 TRINITY_DN3826_c0_g2_i16:34-399(-)
MKLTTNVNDYKSFDVDADESLVVWYNEESKKIEIKERKPLDLKLRSLRFDAYGFPDRIKTLDDFSPAYTVTDYPEYVEVRLDMPGKIELAEGSGLDERDELYSKLVIKGKRELNSPVTTKE